MPSMLTQRVEGRSLKPKLPSLLENFRMNESNINIAMLTETWFTRNDKLLKNQLEHIELDDGVKFIRKDRNSRGGGVALAFDNKKGEFKKLRLCLLYTSPSPRDLSTCRMPSSA